MSACPDGGVAIELCVDEETTTIPIKPTLRPAMSPRVSRLLRKNILTPKIRPNLKRRWA
jgi:hypothetical protein